MRALLSVYDKTGLIDLARGLTDLGVEIVASGNTAAALLDAGFAPLDVATVTGSPEMLSGRVKTLHPKIHGGILADRSKKEHLDDLEANGISLIDLVVCNLYPFSSDPSVELIDIGGPTMVRAAAKNFADVAVVVDPSRYGDVLADLAAHGAITDALKLSLAREAFSHVASYDAAISQWMDTLVDGEDEVLAPSLHLSLDRKEIARYGENPHQRGARYTVHGTTSWWDSVVQHAGKELSYLNVFDADAAWRLAFEMSGDAQLPSVCIIKHANPCGAAVAATFPEAYTAALAADPQSAFGGIVAISGPVTDDLAQLICDGPQADVIIATSYSVAGLAALTARRKATRLLEAPAPEAIEVSLRGLGNMVLVQNADVLQASRSTWTVVTQRQPTEAEWDDMQLAWRLCARTTSNAIVIAKDGQGAGIGAGQQSRVVAAQIAVQKAGGNSLGAAAASDAFFPFPDGLEVLIDAGVTAVIQPGGSIKDQDVTAVADAAGICMVHTGERHFRH